MPEGGAVRLLVQPGLLAAPQPVLALGGVVLRVTADGARLEVGGALAAAVGAPMLERCWYELTALFGGSEVVLTQRALQTSWGVRDSGQAQGRCPPPTGSQLLFAADPAGGRFDGRLEAPALLDAQGGAVASWDFADGIGTDRIAGTHPGRLVNLPTRGVHGASWSGTEMDWKHALHKYAAIHFHADDLYDAG